MVHSSLTNLSWNRLLLLVLFVAGTALTGLQGNGCSSAVHGLCVSTPPLLSAAADQLYQLDQQENCCGSSVQPAARSHCHCEKSAHSVFRNIPAAIISTQPKGIQSPLQAVTLPLWRTQAALRISVPSELFHQPFSVALTKVQKTVLLI